MLGDSPVYHHFYPHRYISRDLFLDRHNNVGLRDYGDRDEHQHGHDYSIIYIYGDFDYYLAEFCHHYRHGDIDISDHDYCVYHCHNDHDEPSDHQFDGDRDVHVCLHSDHDGDRNLYGDYNRMSGNRVRKRSVIGSLILMFVLATAMGTFIAAPNGTNAQTQPHSTSTTIVTSSTDICIVTQCFLVAPPKVTVTSTTTSTSTTVLTDTATSTSTTSTTIPTTTTETVTQVFSTTELTTTIETSTVTETTTTVSSTTITSTQTSTETSTESSTVTGTVTETMTQVTTVDETVTTTITTTITSTVSGGGGGGCVLQGSLITLANGTDVAVQNVVPGMTVLSYDTSLGQLI